MHRGAPLFPEARKRHRVYRGLTERQERIFTWVACGVVFLFVMGWVGAWITLRRQHVESLRLQAKTGVEAAEPTVTPATEQITSGVFDAKTPKTAYINDAMLKFLDPLRGESGKLRFAARQPGSRIVGESPGGAAAVLSGSESELTTEFTAPDNPGIYKLAVQIEEARRAIDEFNVITLVPLAQKRGGRIGLYYLGSWPFETGGKPRTPEYATPSGFIEVTPENQNTYISEHFRLRDFLTKDQFNVWPKYLPLNPKLIDKLELTIQELEEQGIDVKRMAVMSGFRTPRYNHSGGNTAGRANLSRHMYGDAADIFVDNDGNGNMDDLNRDRRVDARDADVILQAAERVERKYPSLVGGIGVYSACCGHGPFTHIDVRGYRARWRGSGNG
jgi:uncharacterized protein YcbK (DUF882 family)